MNAGAENDLEFHVFHKAAYLIWISSDVLLSIAMELDVDVDI